MRVRDLIGFVFVVLWAVAANAQEPLVSIDKGEGNSIALTGQGDPAKHHHLEYSRDLLNWFPLHSEFEASNWDWVHRPVGPLGNSYYRVSQNAPVVDLAIEGIHLSPGWLPVESEPDWIFGVGDPLPDPFYAPLAVHKFIIVLDDLPKIYFIPSSQSAGEIQLHYQYVTEYLEPFKGISLSEYARISEPGPEAQIVPGNLFYSYETGEIGISFVGQGRYQVDSMKHFIDAVVDSLRKHKGRVPLDLDEVFYVPSGGQEALSEMERVWFGEEGIQMTEIGRWLDSDVCYSEGWALGRLRFFSSEQISEAYLSGELLHTDILITDVVPAELPYLAGIITLEAVNPASHPAILARANNIPMAFLADLDRQEEILALLDSEIVLGVDQGPEYVGESDQPKGCQISFSESSSFTNEIRSELLALKALPELEIQAIESLGNIAVTNLAGLSADDIRFVGGKAASFRFLRREYPELSPDALAFTFDLWDEYLDQTLSGGKTLREEISTRLDPLVWPPNIPELEETLGEIRDLFKDEADFSTTQKAAILSTLSGFPANGRLRFRSSTNVEDSEHFVGAGLYSSYSGCVLDDTDGDTLGPSHCDPSRENERGVFRAMRKVYASFYNTNAFIERLRFGVDESQVGMAILVHPSYPDEIEAANGVAISQSGSLTMVSQRGAVSVTNPVDGQLPEIVTFSNGDPRRERRTQIEPELGYVLEWRDDYRALRDVMDSLKQEYFAEGGEATSFDIEYKKLADDSLVVKQFRVIPEEMDTTPEFYITVGDSAQFVMSEEGNFVNSVFSKHRLKASLTLETVPRILDEEGMVTPFFTLDLRVLEGAEFVRYSGDPLLLPGATYEAGPGGQWGYSWVKAGWIGNMEGEEVTYELTLNFASYLKERSHSFLSLDEMEVTLKRTYSTPKVFFEAFYSALPPSVTTEDSILFQLKEEAEVAKGYGSHEKRTVETESGVMIECEYRLSQGPAEIDPNIDISGFRGWMNTRIIGLTTNPIVFSGDFSRTHYVSRHNLVEFSVFEPGRDNNISEAAKVELRAANIHQILFQHGRSRDFEFVPLVFLIDETGNLTSLPVERIEFEGQDQL